MNRAAGNLKLPEASPVVATSVELEASPEIPKSKVFSSSRNIDAPRTKLPRGLKYNTRLKMDGCKFLAKLPMESIPVAFFDPQYRGVLDKLSYGNEGVTRGKARASLEQMSAEKIRAFILAIDKALISSGHLFLWMDKYHLCSGFDSWLTGTNLDVVDMLTWDKGRIGMGYRTRRSSEHVIVLQKQPRKAKGVWTIHNIPDVWREKVLKNGHTHTHRKPLNLQGILLEAVSHPNDIVIDPAAGSFSVLEACRAKGRNFLGCDLNG